VGFVVDEVALGLVFSQCLDFRSQSSFHKILHPQITWDRYKRPEVVDVPSVPSLDSTPYCAIKKKIVFLCGSVVSAVFGNICECLTFLSSY
jgi:hypothetical protein